MKYYVVILVAAIFGWTGYAAGGELGTFLDGSGALTSICKVLLAEVGVTLGVFVVGKVDAWIRNRDLYKENEAFKELYNACRVGVERAYRSEVQPNKVDGEKLSALVKDSALRTAFDVTSTITDASSNEKVRGVTPEKIKTVIESVIRARKRGELPELM